MSGAAFTGPDAPGVPAVPGNKGPKPMPAREALPIDATWIDGAAPDHPGLDADFDADPHGGRASALSPEDHLGRWPDLGGGRLDVLVGRLIWAAVIALVLALWVWGLTSLGALVGVLTT